MTELVIFWGIPLIVMLISMQSPFFQNWRFLLVLSLAGYLALWCFPLFSDLFKAFLPKEIASYAKGISFAGPLAALHIALYQLACNLSSHGGNGYHLPREKNLLIPLLGLTSGFVLSGLIGYTVCLTPLHSVAATDGVFQERAISRVCTLTALIDRLSLQSTPLALRKKKLEARVSPWKKAVKKEKKDNKKAPADQKKTSQKTSFFPGKHGDFSPAVLQVKVLENTSEKLNRKEV